MQANISKAVAITLALTFSISSAVSAQETLITDANGNIVQETGVQIRAPRPNDLPPMINAPVQSPAINAPGELPQWGNAAENTYSQIPSGSVIVPDETTLPESYLPNQYARPQQTVIAPQRVQVAPEVLPVLPPRTAFIPKLGFNGRVISGYGMEVTSVNYGSVAQQIGLEAGDVIIKVDGRPIDCVVDYEQALENAAAYGGGHVDLVVRNVRYRPGCTIYPKFVKMHADLPMKVFVASSEIRDR